MAPEWVSPFASFFSSYTLRPRRTKAALKAKWDHCFERLLDNGLDASRQSRAFWDDLLLLDVNAPLLERLFRERTPDDVHAARANIAATCAECLRRLETRDEEPVLLRVSRALEILILVHRHVARNAKRGGADAASAVINACAGGIARADAHFEALVRRSAALMSDHHEPVALRRLALHLLLAVAASADANVNRNPLLGYFMIHDVYEETMAVLVAPVDVPGGGVSSVTFQGATALLMKREGGGDGGGDERGGGARDEGGGGGAVGEGSSGTTKKSATKPSDRSSDRRPRPPRAGPALGTTAERTRLRAEAAALLAVLLAWSESSNAYARRLGAADGVQLSIIADVANALLADPSARSEADPTRRETTDANAADGAAEADASSFASYASYASLADFFGGAPSLGPVGTNPEDDLLDRLAVWLGYAPPAGSSTDPDPGARVVLRPDATTALLLLRAVVRHSRAPRSPGAWLDLNPKPGEQLLRGVAFGRRWREALGRTLCVARLAAETRRGERRDSARRRRAEGVLALASTTLGELAEDRGAAEYFVAADAARLAPRADAAHVGRSAGGAALELCAVALETSAASRRGDDEGGGGGARRGDVARGLAGVPASPFASESRLVRLAHGLVQARVARGGRPLAIRWDALWSGLLATLGAIARERGGAAAATPEGARVVAQILNVLDFVLVKRRAACDAAEDVAPLLERIVKAADVFERLEELAVKNGYAVGGSGGTSAGDRRATVPGARFANARRVLERVRVDEKDPDSIRVAAMHALATMDPLPTTDRLDADWALGTTIGGGRGGARGFGTGGGGGGGGGGGDDAKVVAAATRALVDAMSAPSSGALAIAPEGLRPKTAAGVSAGGS